MGPLPSRWRRLAFALLPLLIFALIALALYAWVQATTPVMMD
jgi:hypothetical protein